MPEDPNNEMDGLLKRYAQERRKHPDAPIHPATRKMLQGEVSRVYRKAGADKPSFWRKISLPIALASAACVVVVLLIVNQPGRKGDDMQVARTDSKTSTERIREPAISNSANREETSATPYTAATALETKTAQDTAAAQSRPVPESRVARNMELADSAPQPSPQAGLQGRVATPQLGVQPQVASIPQAGAEPAGASAESKQTEGRPDLDTVARFSRQARARAEIAPRVEDFGKAADLTNLGAALRTRFVQAGIAPASISPATNVALFADFKMEQIGSQVRLIENDGSMYVGNVFETNPPIQVPGKELIANQELATNPLPTNALPQELLANSSSLYFNASGSNRTLGRQVIISGAIIERTNSGPGVQNTFSFEPAAIAKQRLQVQQADEKIRRAIVATATVDHTNQVRIQAISKD